MTCAFSTLALANLGSAWADGLISISSACFFPALSWYTTTKSGTYAVTFPFKGFWYVIGFEKIFQIYKTYMGVKKDRIV